MFDAETARGLLAEMTSDMQKIDEQATFHGSDDRQSARRVYEEAIAVLEKRLAAMTWQRDGSFMRRRI